IRELERRLMLKADVVICSSEKLRADKARVNPSAHLVQHGVDLEHFGKAYAPGTTIPDELKGAPGPIIGFWGLIADWVDLQLIRHVERLGVARQLGVGPAPHHPDVLRPR